MKNLFSGLVVACLMVSQTVNVFAEKHTIKISVDQSGIENCMVGVEELKTNQGIIIFPNPNSGSFTLEIEQEILREAINLTIYNSNGQIMMNKPIFSTDQKITEKIELENVSRGIYLITVTSGNELFKSKLMIN